MDTDSIHSIKKVIQHVIIPTPSKRFMEGKKTDFDWLKSSHEDELQKKHPNTEIQVHLHVRKAKSGPRTYTRVITET